jgi:hypothetical protein
MSTKKPVTVALLASIWLTGSMIFASGEAVINYGAFGGILLSVSFLMAFLVLCLLLWRVDKFAEHVLSPFCQKVMLSLLVIMILELLITQGLAAGLILQSLLDFSFDVSVLFFYGLVFVAVLLQRNLREEQLNLLAVTKLIALFIVAILLPNFIFLQKGLETVYYNLIHYHPRVLHLEQTGLFAFFMASSVIMFSKLTIYVPMLQKELTENKKRTLLKLGISVLSWSSIVIAFATMTIIGITERVRATHVNELVLLLVKKVTPPGIYFAVTITMLFIIVVTFLLTLKVAFFYWKQVYPKDINYNHVGPAMLMFLMSVLGSMIAVRLHLSVLDVFFWVGTVSGPVGIVLIYNISFRKTGNITWSFPIISSLAVIMAYLLFPDLRTTQLVQISSFLTATLLVIHFLIIWLFSHNSEKSSNNMKKTRSGISL